MSQQFDSLIIGEVAQDTNVDYDGTTVQATGGAVYYSGFAAANMGHKIAVLPKADTAVMDMKAAFAAAPNVTVFPLHSKTSFVTKNVYHTPDRERRTSTVDSVIEPYQTNEVPAIDAKIWHLAGLVGGDIPNEMIPFAAQHAMVAIDVQTMLRCVENGGMVYHDWAEKKEMLPYVRFLKTDAAEAMRWYRKAAEQGHADAQYQLGSHYELGIGVKKDLDAALKWYHKAAEQGHRLAQSSEESFRWRH